MKGIPAFLCTIEPLMVLVIHDLVARSHGPVLQRNEPKTGQGLSAPECARQAQRGLGAVWIWDTVAYP